MSLPNYIIAGSPKAGTTSIFRYLSVHPQVGASSIKEVHYFNRIEEFEKHGGIEKYKSYFRACHNKNICIEASPRYLIGGGKVAQLIRETIPEAKVIFILRDPVRRYISSYLYNYYKNDLLSTKLEVDELLNQGLRHKYSSPRPEWHNNWEEVLDDIWQGCYSSFLKEYFKYFLTKDMCVLFFDDLDKSPYDFIVFLCDFLNIDTKYYDNYDFKIENRTRAVKNIRVQKISDKINLKLEIFFNKYPLLRNVIRDFYYRKINPEVKEVKENLITETAIEKLKNYYAPYNKDLCALLSEKYPSMKLPNWIYNSH